VQTPKGETPSRVWLKCTDHIQDVCADVRTGFLYYSLKLGLKVICVSGKGKSSLIPLPTIHRDDITNHKIESGAEIMDCVTNHEGPCERYTFAPAEHEAWLAWIRSIRVSLKNEEIWVTCDELLDFPVKLVDVSLGPFNL